MMRPGTFWPAAVLCVACWVLAAAWVLRGGGAAAAAPAGPGCELLLQEAAAALDRRDYPAARSALQRADDSFCERHMIKELGVRAATQLWKRLLDDGKSKRVSDESPLIPARVAEITDFTHLYQAQMLLGDHYLVVHEYKEAREASRKAEDWAQNPPELVERLDPARLDEALEGLERRIAAANVEAFRSDSYQIDGSEFAGLATVQRGACSSAHPLPVQLPIEFEFNSDQPTARGQQLLESFAAALVAAAPDDAVLIGHTDRIGWQEHPDHQMELSRRRAERVARRLQERGYKGTVTTRGVGYKEPIDPARYPPLDQGALDQLDRRVEWFATC